MRQSQESIFSETILPGYLTSLEAATVRLAASLRLHAAYDETPNFAVDNRLSSDIAAYNQARLNCINALQMLKTADISLQNIRAKITRLKTIANELACGNVSDIQSSRMQQEFSTIAQEISRIARDARSNGVQLLCRETLDSPECVTVLLDLGSDPKIKSLDIKTCDVTAEGLCLDTLSVANKDDATSAVDCIQKVQEQVEGIRHYYGAVQDKLTAANRYLESKNTQKSTVQVSEGNIADDMAQFVKSKALNRNPKSEIEKANHLWQMAVLNTFTNTHLKAI